MRFRDRAHAGQLLAASLSEYADRDDVVGLALPRGGVPVGYEVATRLGAPLEAFPVRKLGFPGQEELALGAIAQGGVFVVNAAVAASSSTRTSSIPCSSARPTCGPPTWRLGPRHRAGVLDVEVVNRWARL